MRLRAETCHPNPGTPSSAWPERPSATTVHRARTAVPPTSHVPSACRATGHDVRTSAPASPAIAARRASSHAREIAAPARRVIDASWPSAASSTAPIGIASATAAPAPSAASVASASPDRQQPHTFWRGNAARSARRTRAPPRAAAIAASVPAGPAPITRTSTSLMRPPT